MFRDLLPVLREVLVNAISTSVKHGSKFRDSSQWKCGLLLSRMLGQVYWILGKSNEAKIPLGSIVDIYRLQTPIPPDEYPIDLWLKCRFWAEVMSLCHSSSSLSSINSTTDLDINRLFAIHDNPFLVWIGCLATLFTDSFLIHEIQFLNLHTFLLQDQFLKKKFLNNQFMTLCALALTHVKLLNSPPCLDFDSHHTMRMSQLTVTTQTREEILSFLSICYHLLHAFMMACVVITYSRPVSDRSHLKEICRPLVEMLDR
jgi:hypothetical protein